MERSHLEHKIEVLLLDLPRHIEGLRENLATLLRKQEKFMSQSDDLNAAVVSLASGFQALDASVQGAVTFIQQQPGLSAAAATAIASIGTTTAKMAADAAALTAAIPGATTVPPSSNPNAPAPTPVAAPVVLAPVTVTAPQAIPPATPATPPTSGGGH